MEPVLVELAKHDPNSAVRLFALRKLAIFPARNKDLAISLLNDSSYTVAGEAFRLLTIVDSAMAYQEAKRLSTEKAKGILLHVMFTTLIRAGNESDFDVISSKYVLLPFRIRTTRNYADYLSTIHQADLFKKGIDHIVYIRSCNPHSAEQINKQILEGLLKSREVARSSELADYIKAQLDKN